MHSQKYAIASQDVSRFKEGNYTGEVSAKLLKSIDTKYVIIGHYEREFYFLENEKIVKQKIVNALDENLKVILPIGETRLEYQLAKTKEVLENKLKYYLLDIPKEKRRNIAIAYEPVWKVGTESSLAKKEIMEIILFIKTWLYEHEYPNNPVLYGGGLNIQDIKNLQEIDGFLLGSLSQNVENVLEIMKIC